MVDKEWIQLTKEINTQAFRNHLHRNPTGYDEVLAWIKGLDAGEVVATSYTSNVYSANGKAVEVIQYD